MVMFSGFVRPVEIVGVVIDALRCLLALRPCPQRLERIQQLSREHTLCVFGAGDKDSLCTDLPAGTAGITELPGGHHFDGDYEGLARLILKFAGRTP